MYACRNILCIMNCLGHCILGFWRHGGFMKRLVQISKLNSAKMHRYVMVLICIRCTPRTNFQDYFTPNSWNKHVSLLHYSNLQETAQCIYKNNSCAIKQFKKHEWLNSRPWIRPNGWDAGLADFIKGFFNGGLFTTGTCLTSDCLWHDDILSLDRDDKLAVVEISA